MSEEYHLSAKQIDWLDHDDVPILMSTKKQLEKLRAKSEEISLADIVSVINKDSLLTLRVIKYQQQHRTLSQQKDATTITHCLMLMGMTNFFKQHLQAPTIEELYGTKPEVVYQIRAVLARAYLAAQLAETWATYRHDIHSEEVQVAALLHDISEVLLWMHEPEKMKNIRQVRKLQPGLRSHEAQRKFLGVTINDYQIAIIKHWHLPALLLELMDDAHAEKARILNVVTAVNTARHLGYGWDDAGLPDDIEAATSITGLSSEQTRKTTIRTIWSVAHSWLHFGIRPVICLAVSP